jgi:hypothetical protein
MSSALRDEEAVLGHRHRHADDVGLLEGVGAEQARGLLAGDREHRHGVHVRVGERRDEVRGTGAGGRHAHAELARGGRIAFGRVPGALFVADEDVPDLIGLEERVIGGKDRSAGKPEHRVDSELLEAADDRLSAGEDLGAGCATNAGRCGCDRCGPGLAPGRLCGRGLGCHRFLSFLVFLLILSPHEKSPSGFGRGARNVSSRQATEDPRAG